ncbi:MAG: double zinc ribbon domain-containing protein [Planctomycetaceae bacterium]
MSQLGDPRHREIRQLLRIVGSLVLLCGVVMVAIGMGNFFYSFGSFGPPRYFWCAFVGMPLIFVGAILAKFAYLGSITRFMAEEVTPVGIDTFNTMADGTSAAVRDIASAVGAGLHAGLHRDANERAMRCHQCHDENPADAKFCQSCGTSLSENRLCAQCGEVCEPEAKFCHQCGTVRG